MSNENNFEQAEEAVETVAEEAQETVEEKAEEVQEAAEEKAEEVQEAAEEKAEEVKKAAPQRIEAAKAQPKAAPVIKKKKGVNVTTLVVIIVCAVVVLACAAFVLWKTDTFAKWFQKASYTLKPHDTIEISEDDVTVSDDSIETYITSFQTAYETTEEETSGTVEDGDELHITYVGTIDGEEFDGGTTDEDGADLTIGSGSYIDGFEDGLIGEKIGDTVTLNLTFPDDYSNEDVAGKDVVFEVTIEYRTVTNTPEFTDDFVKENSAEYTETRFGESVQLDTVDDYRDYVTDYLYNLYFDDSLEDAIADLIEVKSYDYTTYHEVYDYQLEALDYYASYYGVDADTLASYYGYDDAATYCEEVTKEQLNTSMLYQALADENGISFTDEEVDASIQEYMDENGYSDSYTLEEFKELNGDAWLYNYRTYEMNYEPVMDIMRDRVVIVASTEEETTAEETSEAEETSAN